MDAVTSLGGMDVRVDEWGVDACYSGTQKCLSIPSGGSPITFSERAMRKVRNRKQKPCILLRHPGAYALLERRDGEILPSHRGHTSRIRHP